MGATGCKPAKGSGLDEEPEHVESISVGKGVRVHQLEGNNFLGRLEDAARMSYRGRGLWRRGSSGGGPNCSAKGSATTGASSSARSSCYSELSSSVWQQQQLQLQQQQQQSPINPCRRLLRQHILSTAATSSGATTGPSNCRSLDSGAPVDRNSGSSSPDAESGDADAAAIHASQMDLTTLLLQGFDPAAYEQRLADRRLAKFSGRRQPRSILSSASTKTATAVSEAAGAATAEAAEAPGRVQSAGQLAELAKC